MAARALAVRAERWAIAGGFAISRGRKSHAHVVVAEVSEAGASGRGECVPYGHYGESVAGVVAALEDLRAEVEAGLDRESLARRLPAGAARNALDCALWDLEARRCGEPVWRRAGLPEPRPVWTAFTLGLDTPAAMAAAARAAAGRPLLKLKLGGEDPLARVAAVREAAPQARLIADANEAWTLPQLESLAPRLAQLGVELVEQPLPAGADGGLRDLQCGVRLCADESCRGAGLEPLAGLYDLVNVKLDKAGGLTRALEQVEEARRLGLGVMVGCMVGTSLGIAPALLLAGGADYVDLDGPLLLERDREPGLVYEGSRILPPSRALWG